MNPLKKTFISILLMVSITVSADAVPSPLSKNMGLSPASPNDNWSFNILYLQTATLTVTISESGTVGAHTYRLAANPNISIDSGTFWTTVTDNRNTKVVKATNLSLNQQTDSVSVSCTWNPDPPQLSSGTEESTLPSLPPPISGLAFASAQSSEGDTIWEITPVIAPSKQVSPPIQWEVSVVDTNSGNKIPVTWSAATQEAVSPSDISWQVGPSSSGLLNTYAGTVNSQEPSKGKIKATYEQSQTTTSPELSFYGVRLYQVNHPDGSSTEIPDSGKAWITKDPEMPQLQIKVSPDHLPSNLTISWKLQVTYNRPINSGLPQDTVSIPANGQFTSPVSCAQPINIFQHADWSQAVNTGFFGGTATLTYSIGGSPAQSITFTIGGKNPAPSQARSYIDQNNQGISYAYAIAKHESKGYAQAYYNQFENSGIPLHHEDDTGPGGFGVFQVTVSTPLIPRKQIWNWRENIVAGINIVSDKRNYWSTIGEEHKSGALAWMNMTNLNPNGIPKGQRPQANLQMGTTVPVPDETQGTLTFSDSGNFKIEEAVTIKMYNGASAHYCAWDNIGQVWKFNRTRPSDGKNYVNLVANEID